MLLAFRHSHSPCMRDALVELVVCIPIREVRRLLAGLFGNACLVIDERARLSHGCTSAMSACAAISSAVRELWYIRKFSDPSGMMKAPVG
jgi:hypothetical protein